jgi:hypothetical protein
LLPAGGLAGGRLVTGIGGDDGLAGAAGADDDVGVGDVGGSAGGEQPADAGCVDPVQVGDVGGQLADEPRQPGLPVRPANGLGQCGRGHGDVDS